MKHQVFISWSGEPSKQTAEALREWIPLVLQAADPWLSTGDLLAGARWTETVADRLSKSDFGILCLTRTNVDRPWLLFEAGALSKSFQKSRVIPYVLDVTPAELTMPLSQFQAVTADELGTFKLLQSLNESLGEDALADERLERVFRQWWPELDSRIGKIRREQIERATSEIAILRSPKDRTESIVADLGKLGELPDRDLANEFVLFAGALSAFAISDEESQERSDGPSLLKERDVLRDLARRGCTVRCMITPPERARTLEGQHSRVARMLQTLIEFMKSKDAALQHIDWVVSPYLQQNFYIIGKISCHQGFKQGTQPGFHLTLRQSASDAVRVNTELFNTVFEDFKLGTVETYGSKDQGDRKVESGNKWREALRTATLNCLEQAYATHRGAASA